MGIVKGSDKAEIGLEYGFPSKSVLRVLLRVSGGLHYMGSPWDPPE